jgi:hypothetical protein
LKTRASVTEARIFKTRASGEALRLLEVMENRPKRVQMDPKRIKKLFLGVFRRL